MGIFNGILKLIFGTKNDKDIKELLPDLRKINLLESEMTKLQDSDFVAKTAEFKERYANGETLDSLLPEAFALVREAAWRKLKERHYDVQLLGSMSLHKGGIMEMKTGEGKTLSSVPAAYLNSLTGKGVHLITVNDYLAERDANWMRPVYDLLGITVAHIAPDMDNEVKKKAYEADITYGTNNEFGFDYLRDNLKGRMEEKVQRPFHYCIIDEVDSILIDEARTPLIISGAAEDDSQKCHAANNVIGRLEECQKDPTTDNYPTEDSELVGDYTIDEKSKRIKFTNQGLDKIEEALLQRKTIEGSLYEGNNFEYVHYVTQALRAKLLFKRDVDYVVQKSKVEIVDEFTGRILEGRRYSEGLHQAIEAKEHIPIARRNRTFATITFQNYFRMYEKLSGMTGTADTEAKEFAKIYNMGITVIPTNRPVARNDEDDTIYLNETFKFEAICNEIAEAHKTGQPILVGTVSIEKSELLSHLLRKKGIKHEVLNAKNHGREALIIAEAGAKGSVTIATNMAGRGTDIKLGGNYKFRAQTKSENEETNDKTLNIIRAEREKWEKDYEEVKSLGGLYIIGTERHESRRIDNQLRGRSGRQGDPGRSKFFISLDDDLMRLFGGERLKNMMSSLGMADGEPIYHKFISNAIEKAQMKVEDRNFEIRKHLLEYDNVLNEQRNFIYAQRDNILKDENIIVRVFNAIEEITTDILEEYQSSSKVSYHDVMDKFKQSFNFLPDIDADTLRKSDTEKLAAQISEKIKSDLQEKISLVGDAAFNQFLRHQYITNVDRRWQEHLEEMEELRDGVYLRSYGQKNPLEEYKQDGFRIFDNLIYEIRSKIAQIAVKIQIERNPAVGEAPKEARSNTPQNLNFSHQSAGSFGRGQGIGDQKIQVVNQNKVGRNEPCPCGSNKKFKNCCGAN